MGFNSTRLACTYMVEVEATGSEGKKQVGKGKGNRKEKNNQIADEQQSNITVHIYPVMYGSR